MGKQGDSLLLLTPSETDYLSILSQIKVPIEPLSASFFPLLSSISSDIFSDFSQEKKTFFTPEKKFSPATLLAQTRAWAVADRDVLEKGVKAYTAFVRGYSEHHCKVALPLERLPFGRLAKGFGLVYAPAIWDIAAYPKKRKGQELPGFEELEANVAQIEFLDRNKQKMRLQSVARRQESKAARLSTAKAKREMALRLKREGVHRRRKIKQSERQKQLFEWDGLARETALWRRVRKGKMTRKEYEVAVGERKRE